MLFPETMSVARAGFRAMQLADGDIVVSGACHHAMYLFYFDKNPHTFPGSGCLAACMLGPPWRLVCLLGSMGCDA